MAQVLPSIYKNEGKEDRGENARLQCFLGAIAIGDMMKTSFGPRGMDKILQPINSEPGIESESQVTNDGATILKKLWVDNPSARILIDLSKRQDQEIGDGTTGVVILASELLRQAQQLIEKNMHPQTVIQGFRIAQNAALKKLSEISFESYDEQSKIQNLKRIAMTTLGSKVLSTCAEHFADIVVKAVLRLKNPQNIKMISVIKKSGGSFKNSSLEDGMLIAKVLSMGSKKQIKNPRILVANTSMDADKVKIYGAKVHATDYNQVADIEEAEREKMRKKVDLIAKTGCNLFVNRQLVYDYPLQLLHERGISVLPHADFEGIEHIAAAVGAEVCTTFNDLNESVLGTCEFVEEVLISESKFTRFRGCKKQEACSVLLRGASEHLLNEAERSLHDAIAIVSQACIDGRIIYGAGCSEMAMAMAVEKAALEIADKRKLAILAFSKALQQIPFIIAENGGFDASNIVAKLQTVHATQENCYYGVDINNGDVCSIKAAKIYETYKSKLHQLKAACEAAEQLIRVDSIITCPPAKQH